MSAFVITIVSGVAAVNIGNDMLNANNTFEFFENSL